MSNFEELQVMYDSFTAKMKEYNIDVTDLDDAVIDRVSASVESPLEELKGTVDRGTEGVRSVVDSAQKVKGETEDSIEEFDNAVDWKAVLLDLPPQLQKLTNLILAGVRDPKMLLPNLSCCAGVPLDLDNITANAVQEEATRSASATNPNQERWRQVGVQVGDNVAEVAPLLEAVKAAKDTVDSFKATSGALFDDITSIFGDVNSTQESGARSLEKMTTLVAGGATGVKTRSIGDSSPKAMTVLKSLYSDIHEAKNTGVEMNRSLEKVRSFKSAWSKLWTDLTTLHDKLVNVEWGKVSTTLVKTSQLMPTVVKTGREIMYPKFPLNVVFQPSSFAHVVERTVDETNKVCDIESTASTIRKVVNKILGLFGKSISDEGTVNRDAPSGGAVVTLQRNVDVVEQSTKEVVETFGNVEFWDDLQNKCSDAVKLAIQEEGKQRATAFASATAQNVADYIGVGSSTNTQSILSTGADFMQSIF